MARLRDRLAFGVYALVQCVLLAPSQIWNDLKLDDIGVVALYASIGLATTFFLLTHLSNPGYISIEQIQLSDTNESKLSKVSSRSTKLSGEQNDSLKSRTKSKGRHHKGKSSAINFAKDFAGAEAAEAAIPIDSRGQAILGTPPKKSGDPQQQQQHNQEDENDCEGGVIECELTMEQHNDDPKSKSLIKSFKFEDSAVRSADKQDFEIFQSDPQLKMKQKHNAIDVNAFDLPSVKLSMNELNSSDGIGQIEAAATLSYAKVRLNNGSAVPTVAFTSDGTSANQTDNVPATLTAAVGKNWKDERTTEASTKFTMKTMKTNSQNHFTTLFNHATEVVKHDVAAKKTKNGFEEFQDAEEDEQIEGGNVNDDNANEDDDQNMDNKLQTHHTAVEEDIQLGMSHRGMGIQESAKIPLNRPDSTISVLASSCVNAADSNAKSTNEDVLITENELQLGQCHRGECLPSTHYNNNNSVFKFEGVSGAIGDSILLRDSKHKHKQFTTNFSQQKQDLQESHLQQQLQHQQQHQEQGQHISLQQQTMLVERYIEKRYCNTCFVNMPVRSKHCKDCGRCVARYDHHCPWVGNCIGERNKCVFYWFLIMQLLEIAIGISQVFMFYFCFQYFTTKTKGINLSEEGETDDTENILRCVAVSLMSVIFFFVAALFVYHTWFGISNISTWEYSSWHRISYLQDIPESFGSPFSQGFVKNCISFCTFRLFSRTLSNPSYTRHPDGLQEAIPVNSHLNPDTFAISRQLGSASSSAASATGSRQLQDHENQNHDQLQTHPTIPSNHNCE